MGQAITNSFHEMWNICEKPYKAFWEKTSLKYDTLYHNQDLDKLQVMM